MRSIKMKKNDNIKKPVLKKALLLLLALGLTAGTASAKHLDGGWALHENEAAALPEDAEKAFDKAMETLVGCDYKPVALLASQVVAGMNYCILCETAPVVPDPVPYYTLVYIYADLQGGAEVSNVIPLDIGMLWQTDAAALSEYLKTPADDTAGN